MSEHRSTARRRGAAAVTPLARRALAVALVAVAGLGGCGSDDGEGAATDPTAADQQAAGTAPTTEAIPDDPGATGVPNPCDLALEAVASVTGQPATEASRYDDDNKAGCRVELGAVDGSPDLIIDWGQDLDSSQLLFSEAFSMLEGTTPLPEYGDRALNVQETSTVVAAIGAKQYSLQGFVADDLRLQLFRALVDAWPA